VGADAALSERYYAQFTVHGTGVHRFLWGRPIVLEDEDRGQGVFTGSFGPLGCREVADNNPEDGLVTLVELQRFLENDVTDWGKRHGKTQQPQVNLESAYGDMPIGAEYGLSR